MTDAERWLGLLKLGAALGVLVALGTLASWVLQKLDRRKEKHLRTMKSSGTAGGEPHEPLKPVMTADSNPSQPKNETLIGCLALSGYLTYSAIACVYASWRLNSSVWPGWEGAIGSPFVAVVVALFTAFFWFRIRSVALTSWGERFVSAVFLVLLVGAVIGIDRYIFSGNIADLTTT